MTVHGVRAHHGGPALFHLEARRDPIAEADLAEFEKRRAHEVKRHAKAFYSLGSGFVHGFKCLAGYVFDNHKLDDSDLLAVTLDAFRKRSAHDRGGGASLRGAVHRAAAGPEVVAQLSEGPRDTVSDLAAD
ncbi:hypothetical protein [Mycobacterium sp. AT1]|uniref:hypothetical protein n=1 Tax=Mycobacterium sp. AT1 TaxID=1961706 RepID=UPI0009ADB3FC|nr:hypothetical protein [Mycobacterium sp. AT1]OPX05551.1 hypothetical protein B1790_31385 [Mycobacterium sp. AT1]